MDPSARDTDAFPDQTAYKFQIADSEGITPPSLEGGRFLPLIYTTDVMLVQFEGEPGARIPWHTSYPNIDTILYTVAGTVSLTLECPDGEVQELDLEADDVGYMPAGARYTLAVVGDAGACVLCCQGKESGIMESLVGEEPFPNKDEWPVSLWVDRLADEIKRRNEDIVER